MAQIGQSTCCSSFGTILVPCGPLKNLFRQKLIFHSDALRPKSTLCFQGRKLIFAWKGTKGPQPTSSPAFTIIIMRTSVAIRGVAAAVVASGQAGHVSSSITSVIIIIIIIIITRPKPPYGRQGLAGLWGKDTVRLVHFGVSQCLTSRHGAQLRLDIVI